MIIYSYWLLIRIVLITGVGGSLIYHHIFIYFLFFLPFPLLFSTILLYSQFTLCHRSTWWCFDVIFYHIYISIMFESLLNKILLFYLIFLRYKEWENICCIFPPGVHIKEALETCSVFRQIEKTDMPYCLWWGTLCIRMVILIFISSIF